MIEYIMRCIQVISDGKKKKLFVGARIFLILVANDKTVMSFRYGDQVFWPIYTTIGNLDAKLHQSQNWLGILLLGSIPIFYKQAKDLNNKNRDLKVKIYHLALETMLKHL